MAEMERSTEAAHHDLIQLNEQENALLQFDPLSSRTGNEKPGHGTGVIRRPSRPPPPPPTQPLSVKMRSSTVSSSIAPLSNDLIRLDFDDKPWEIKKRRSETNVFEMLNTPSSRASFVSYVDSGGIASDQLNSMKTNNSALPKRVTPTKEALPLLAPSSFVSYVENDPRAVSNNTLSKTQSLSSLSLPHGNIELKSMGGSTEPNMVAKKLIGQREELMLLYMAKREDNYTLRRPFSIFAGTWNVNGQFPPESVTEWTGVGTDPPDIYVIGFQELDLSKEAFVFAESSREDEWVKVVSRSLHPQANYQFVKLVRLVGMMLLMFATKKHKPHIREVCIHQVGTGLLGKMGNKGGVGIRFKLHNTTVCVVNSHLAAHAEETQRRNQDYSDICARMRFPHTDGQLPHTIFQHDVVIWLGDLNYRIDKLLPDVVKECIDSGQYKLLKEQDQLSSQRQEGKVFKNFEEGEITFKPTYKYNPGTDQWDTSEKCRTPAWCDRILWKDTALFKNSKEKPITTMFLRQYRSHQSLLISDHKPVSASFEMSVKVIDEERYRKVYEEESRKLDKMENDWLPSMALSNHTVEFGNVMFQQPVTQTIELHNTGQVPCNFEFIKKIGDDNFCKPWLTISKPKGIVLPDEKSEVEFEIYVNKNTASLLNMRVEKLEDILILHLVGGKDFFLSLNGSYIPSCFGTSIEALCRMKKPIQQISIDKLQELCKISADGTSQLESEKASQVPKELWRLLDHLYNNGRHQPGLFQQPGLHHEFQEIQQSLDSQLPPTNGENTLPGAIHSAAEALLVFLETLPEPVIPFSYYELCLEVHNNFEKSVELLKTMPLHHRNVFNYLIAFLQELPKYESENGLDVHSIATIFSGLILRPPQRKSGIDCRIDREKCTFFIKKFLMNNLENL